MSGYQKVTLIGRATANAEKLGDKGAKFTIATSEQWTDKEGNKQERTEFHNCVAFGGLGEKVVLPYVEKGKMLFVEGKISTNKVEEKYFTNIVISDLKLL